MRAEDFTEILQADFYTGVPDSQLKALCDYLMERYGTDSRHHLIAANEGNCTAIAAGYHMATGKYPVVYMQNSGEGNAVNPIASLLHEKVYNIPVIFVIGWRGEPGVHDEPQHIFQGEVTLPLLKDLQIPYFVVEKETDKEAVSTAMEDFKRELFKNHSVAFVIKKGALSCEIPVKYSNGHSLNREAVIETIAEYTGSDPVISTTGKISRELFEIRERHSQDHKYDFLTVGSMGHSSSIALGIALQKPETRVWCIDGDGAMLMHMGSLAVIGSVKPENLIHIVLNNGAHETVGGMPTAAEKLDVTGVAESCGYEYVASVSDMESLKKVLSSARENRRLTLIEVKCAIGSRGDLGRPTTAAQDNKRNFMEYLNTI
ncbi:MAG: phosphonopyruvate decarboxylase [Lachnospiraceae bacterium]|nr:phosphonopyruvate decarboxylase [Lachnospiraceae bacterium]